jgi:hypothetical protein
VISILSPRFWPHYRALPQRIRDQARQAYALFAQDPHHPSLRYKCVHPTLPVYSVRVGIDYRVVGVLDGNEIHWFWIGPHAEYEQLLKQL